VRLSNKFGEALVYATGLHREQLRKGTQVPYICHLLGVCGLVLEHGGAEDDAIAALLHDALEDQPRGGRTRDEIRERFGERVLATVEECSDADTHPKPPWRLRKERYIAHVPEASPSALLVSACDKLHNARALVRDYKEWGDSLWSRFNATGEETLWYYRSLVTAYREARLTPALLGELEGPVKELEGLLASPIARGR